MLKPKALSEVLAQVTNGGIQSTVLLTRDGALLAYSGFEAKDAKIIAAMASSIFAAHQRVRQTPASTLPQNMVGSGDLNMILLDAEEGKMAIASVATQLVCMVAKTSVQLGMLKAKMDALSSYLQEPLRQVSQSNN
ncbi:unnamed protein product [Rotaria sordida]|uniref:Roadblock/LAMTOR2 domain-containing protein n=1 Tax=Rotaria sordida TaxID=392033 RepID=A0A818QLH6_9BILA|nr:unnamed protein product [Rotaria sordida]CAF1263839.1 unnamed protein product [Rotaria sordida]CAF1296043.1 unnamed protein product [Rotaria sordida]CAF1303103.1 unnamed protein product [Rotaria sordida]CAF1303261.1 unnamed protein product [Rotaria sordida]